MSTSALIPNPRTLIVPGPPVPRPDLEIVVPVYNERIVLEGSLRHLHGFLTTFPFSWRIVIADNASTDGTLALARRLSYELDAVEVIHLPGKGRGRALRAAWTASDARVLCYMDADLSTDLAALLPLVAPLISGHSDVAIGARLARGARVQRGRKRELISRGYNHLLRVALRARFSDAQCGFKAIRADVARELLPLVLDEQWFFDTELLVAAQRRGLRIHEVPVDWVEDQDSRVDIVATALADLRGIARLLRHREPARAMLVAPRAPRAPRRPDAGAMSSSDSLSYPAPWTARLRARARGGARVNRGLTRVLARPELLGLLGLAGVLNLWGLSINGWANTYYSAAVRSMTLSWHNFLFASLDQSGLMTVDKPPLSLWVQALSARVFGFHPLSLLIPQALMGAVAVGLIYDLTRRRFGRPAGFVAALTLATTPVVVAVSRHNNPDELLVLCCVAALWFALRALDTRRTRWLVLSGVAVGLGFETKMGVALMVVPGIAAAWMWLAPRRLAALRQLLAGGAAMVLVGGAWPLLVALTPAADRPWISGTSDNSIFSLIFGYNGLGRLAGQTGGPGGGGAGGGGGGGTMFGGATGPFRLLQSGLGDQAGWLLGFALVSGLGLLVLSRLRRRDPRTGWLLLIGGAFASTAVVFSFASGIFHPYYVSLLAPFAAALVGAGVGQMLAGPRGWARMIAPLAIVAGAVTELVVLHELSGQLAWASPLVIAVAAASALLLAFRLTPRVRAVVVGVALAALLAAPATWAAQTLGHATNGTFPTGGPASASFGGQGPGARFSAAGLAAGAGGSMGRVRGVFPGSTTGPGGPGGPGAFGGAGGGPPAGGGSAAAGGGPPAGGGAFGGNSSTLTAAIRYAKAHGGGTIGVSSQSSAAAAILSTGGDVAGLGGFSGRESSVTAAWLASEVRSGHLRWVLADAGSSARLPGDTRTGSQSAIADVEKACRAVTFTSSAGSKVTMYDCAGRAAAIITAASARG